MRKLFISDIHGCYSEMKLLLENACFDSESDQLVVGGDMIDRGPDSAKVVAYIKGLQEKHPHTVIVLLGNHEDMLHMYLSGKNAMWLGHGQEAMKSFEEHFTEEAFREHMEWLFRQSVMYGDRDYVYVHAGIEPSFSLHEQSRDEVLWMPYSRSQTRFSAYKKGDILKVTSNRKVVHGHTPVASVKDDGARICCDLGAAVYRTNAKLALVDLSAGQYDYYDFQTKTIKREQIEKV